VTRMPVTEAALDDDLVSGTELPNGMAPELLSRYEKTREGAVKEFGLQCSEDLAHAIHSTAGNVPLGASKWRRPVGHTIASDALPHGGVCLGNVRRISARKLSPTSGRCTGKTHRIMVLPLKIL
jgi:hypothetical protein